MKFLIAITLTAAVALGAAIPDSQADKAGAKTKADAASAVSPADAAVIRAQKPSYPTNKCIVSGEKLDDKAIDFVVDGRLVRLCCTNCAAKADTDKGVWIGKVDALVIANQTPNYPLILCPISGEKITSKGDGFDVVYGTKLVRLCCKDCKPAFDKDPAAAMAKVDKGWIEAQLPTYPLGTCPVSDEKLGTMGDPIDVLYGTTLIRLCCSGCKSAVAKDGPELVAKVEAARKKK